MTTKDLIIQELEHFTEGALEEVLEVVRSLKAKHASTIRPEVWQAYLDSERENEEVYRRLADS